MPRAICVDNKKVFEFVQAERPFYDHVMVLVNGQRIGGAAFGGIGVITYGDVPAMLHELGHTFAGLGDEYEGDFSAPTYEPNFPNLTINNDPASVKWSSLIGTGAG